MSNCKHCAAGIPITYDVTGHMHLVYENLPFVREWAECTDPTALQVSPLRLEQPAPRESGGDQKGVTK